jgi:hypothetical protein
LRWRRELNPINLLLLVGIALLLWAILLIWWGGGSLPSRSASAKGPVVPTAPILREQYPLSAFKIVAAKNLFSQDRSGPGPGPGKVHDSLEGRSLLGTMIIGNTRAAIIGSKIPAHGRRGKPEIEVIYLGEEWSGYKLVAISNDSVVFQGKDGRKTLNFPE